MNNFLFCLYKPYKKNKNASATKITPHFLRKNELINMNWANILKLRTDTGLQETVDAMIDTMYSKLFDDDTMTESYDMDYLDKMVDKELRPMLLKEVQDLINAINL